MATYCAGVLISELRKKRGITQEKLAEGLCDRRTISYIENGSISPGKYLFEQLMQRLGVDPKRFSSYIASREEMYFDEMRNRIAQLFRENKTDEILDLLESMEKNKSFKNNKYILQYILKTRAWIVAGGMDWHNAHDLELVLLLDKAIHLTLENFDIKHMDSDLYTVIEIDIIRMYGLWNLFTDKKEEALRIFTQLDSIIQTGYIFSEDISDAHASLLVALAKCYRWLERYEEALSTSERGLDLCAETQSYRSLPWQLYQKASALYRLGRKDEALAAFDDGIIIARNYKEFEMMEFMQQRKEDILSGKF
ncbi:MAG TPA: helix-turn-helix domain-containing protein [Clostridiaceae bacterium]|nr:helix-turn-helix domain-containing protein [Clostridiaceae bacterium]